MTFARASIPALVAAYAACPAMGLVALSELNSTIRPKPRSHMPPNTARTIWNVPCRFTETMRCHNSSG
jgi:hypothetical protein